uniref:Uncharacterized protein n=1 Tax=Panagrellus redivivus TaxID=6233 RepID=A0A7E4V0Y1_PANRE
MSRYFNPDTIDWDFFLSQGQHGGGSYFRGMPYQRGLALADEGFNTASRIIENLNKGGGLKNAVNKEGRRGIQNILTKAADTVGPQKGEGRKRRVALTKIPPPSIRKKKKLDALGLY